MATPATRAADREGAEQALLARRTAAATSALVLGMDPAQIVASWSVRSGEVWRLILAAQGAGARLSAAYVDSVLLAAGFNPGPALLDPTGFAGIAQDGQSIESVIPTAPAIALRRVVAGENGRDALGAAARWMTLLTRTAVRVSSVIHRAAAPSASRPFSPATTRRSAIAGAVGITDSIDCPSWAMPANPVGSRSAGPGLNPAASRTEST